MSDDPNVIYGAGVLADGSRWKVIRLPAGQRGQVDGAAVFGEPITGEVMRRLLENDEPT